jgi:hypothetical protein
LGITLEVGGDDRGGGGFGGDRLSIFPGKRRDGTLGLSDTSALGGSSVDLEDIGAETANAIFGGFLDALADRGNGND